tara:strand:- start:2163 stop:3107 length:945 start_codon:yes stop_codon:yes gene_type:complete
MSVLVHTESWGGSFRKSTYEAVSFANKTAKTFNTDVIAIASGNESDEELKKLGTYGANKVLAANNIEKGDSQALTNLFANNMSDADIIIFASTYTSKMIAPRLASKIKAGILSNVISITSSKKLIEVKRNTFSGKAIENAKINTEKAIISLAPNAFGLIECQKDCQIQRIEESNTGNITVSKQEVTNGKVSLAEAEIIISGGRGLKGPENWKMIEELANILGAATACSKPVSDIGWRPHSEHVGQTGKAVAPNLYIAIGISGAIQHLAGVNSSKIMVVINTDPEAPFFKAADYGIVGDAFEIVPKLIEEIKKIR